MGASKPFDKVLVANRGEIARRVMRTCRRLGIRTVAVYSEADARGAPRDRRRRGGVRRAAAGEGLVPERRRNPRRCAQTGAQAVHPGYGFLSERPAFARAVAEAGAVFIGPPPACSRRSATR